MNDSVHFDPKSAYRESGTMVEIYGALRSEVLNRLRSIDWPEMPASTRAQVQGLVAEAVSIAGEATMGANTVSKAVRDKAYGLEDLDVLQGIKTSKKMRFAGAVLDAGGWIDGDVIAVAVGGVDVSDWKHPQNWDFQLSHASITSRTVKVASFASNFIGVGEAKALYKARKAWKAPVFVRLLLPGGRMSTAGAKGFTSEAITMGAKDWSTKVATGAGTRMTATGGVTRISMTMRIPPPVMAPIKATTTVAERKFLVPKPPRFPNGRMPFLGQPAQRFINNNFTMAGVGQHAVNAYVVVPVGEAVESTVWDGPDGQLVGAPGRIFQPSWRQMVPYSAGTPVRTGGGGR